MNLKPLSLVSVLVATHVISGVAMAQREVKVDGSSTVFPVTEAVAEEFQIDQKSKGKDVRVTVGISGTGGGFKKFVRGEIDVTDASRPILAKEMEEAAKNGIEYIELPIAFDALTICVHPKNTWVKQLTVQELKTMWSPESQGKILTWKQVNPAWPDSPLKLYGPGSDSGTFDYFTEAVNGKAKASRTDYGANEDDNMLVQGVSSDAQSLGYFGYAYYSQNKDKLKAIPVVNPAGKAVLPTPETTKDASYAPLARPVFLYVSKKSLAKPEVRAFVEFYLTNATRLVDEVGYIPLPEASYQAGLERLKAGATGTCFGGHSEAGLHIDELFKRPLTSVPHADPKPADKSK